jgi:hypothetical protein
MEKRMKQIKRIGTDTPHRQNPFLSVSSVRSVFFIHAMRAKSLHLHRTSVLYDHSIRAYSPKIRLTSSPERPNACSKTKKTLIFSCLLQALGYMSSTAMLWMVVPVPVLTLGREPAA